MSIKAIRELVENVEDFLKRRGLKLGDLASEHMDEKLISARQSVLLTCRAHGADVQKISEITGYGQNRSNPEYGR